ncbi:MAG: hypothetical protein QM703_03505 [Gemmatales bacterium]
MTIRSLSSGWLSLLVLAFVIAPVWADDTKPTDNKNAPISYDKQIRPIFQAHCQGCHQPAKAKSGYVMTTFDKLIAGGESGAKAIIPKDTENSHLLDLITPENGKAKMPPDGRAPLAGSDIDLIKRWIAEGAKTTLLLKPSLMALRTRRLIPGLQSSPPSIILPMVNGWPLPVSMKCCSTPLMLASSKPVSSAFRNVYSRCGSRRTVNTWPSLAGSLPGSVKSRSGSSLIRS